MWKVKLPKTHHEFMVGELVGRKENGALGPDFP